MGKDSKSSTQNTYPAWLMAALKPLMEGSAARMGEFQSQGYNVLQGRSPNEGVAMLAPGATRQPTAHRQGSKIDPELWAQIVASRGGNT
jgi:hypothetical protein